MATADVIAAEVQADGVTLRLTFEAMDYSAISAIVGAVTVTVGSTETYSGTSLTTTSRTVNASQFLASTQNGSDADVDVSLDFPVHDDDASIVASVPADFVDDGANGSNAYSDTVTNSSTLDYSEMAVRPVGRIDGTAQHRVPREACTGELTIEVMAGNRHGPAATVTVEFDDSSTQNTLSATSMSRSSYRDARFFSKYEDRTGNDPWSDHDSAGCGVFAVGPFDLSDYDDGLITITITAYPAVGDADAVQSVTTLVYNNDGGTLTTTNLYFGTSGSDSTGDGSTGTPYATITKCLGDTAGTTTTTIYNILCKEAGTYALTEFGSVTTNSILLTIKPDPSAGLADTDVILTTDEPGVHRLLLENVKLDNSGGALQGGNKTDDYVCGRNVEVYSSDGRSGESFKSSGWINSSWDGGGNEGEWVDCDIGDFNAKGLTTQAFVRNSVVHTYAEDGLQNVRVVFATWTEGGIETDPPSQHADGYQHTGVSTNVILANSVWFDFDGQGMYIGDNGAGRCLVVNCLWINKTIGNLAQIGKTNNPAVDDVCVWHCTFVNQSLSIRNDSNLTNTVIDFGVHAGVGGPSERAFSGSRNYVLNPDSTADEVFGWDVSSGADDEFEDGTYYGDVASEATSDFRPSSGSTITTIPSGEVLWLFDAFGYARPNDGTGHVGAWEVSSVAEQPASSVSVLFLV